MVDSIAALSVTMSQQTTQQKVGTSVMKMAMDTAEQSADVMMDSLKSLQHAAQPNLGANLDILA